MKAAVRRALLIFLCAAVVAPVLANEGPGDALPADAPKGISGDLWERMKLVDARAGSIKDLSTGSSRRRPRRLLKKPIVSRGTLLARGATMLWKTQTPEATEMRIDQKQIELYYTSQKTVEIYAVQGAMRRIASSPIPRLAALLRQYSFTPAAPGAFGSEEAKTLSLQMTPTAADIQEHVQSASVQIDETTGTIRTLIITDTDGDSSEVRFTEVKINSGIEEQALAPENAGRREDRASAGGS